MAKYPPAYKRARVLVHLHYRAITKGVVGAFYFQQAIKRRTPEFYKAKKCAMICANEILNERFYLGVKTYWKIVVEEINNL